MRDINHCQYDAVRKTTLLYNIVKSISKAQSESVYWSKHTKRYNLYSQSSCVHVLPRFRLPPVRGMKKEEKDKVSLFYLEPSLLTIASMLNLQTSHDEILFVKWRKRTNSNYKITCIQNNLHNQMQKMQLCCISFLPGSPHLHILTWKKSISRVEWHMMMAYDDGKSVI